MNKMIVGVNSVELAADWPESEIDIKTVISGMLWQQSKLLSISILVTLWAVTFGSQPRATGQKSSPLLSSVSFDS